MNPFNTFFAFTVHTKSKMETTRNQKSRATRKTFSESHIFRVRTIRGTRAQKMMMNRSPIPTRKSFLKTNQRQTTTTTMTVEESFLPKRAWWKEGPVSWRLCKSIKQKMSKLNVSKWGMIENKLIP